MNILTDKPRVGYVGYWLINPDSKKSKVFLKKINEFKEKKK